ncbi:MAG: nucleoside deaminase [Gemmatimonadota bacterium]
MIRIDLPHWIGDVADLERTYTSRADRMGLCIALARENVLRDRGGPFGAAVFESESGRLVGVGVNRVVPLNNSVLHAEIVAYMKAEQRVGSYTLAADGLPAHELVTTCEPCAMCLGGALWAGVQRIIFGATRDDAAELNFDEGPVFPESYEYLEARGVEIVRAFMREEARAVFRLYREQGGPIYNA